mgnify:CR=1 FL=1
MENRFFKSIKTGLADICYIWRKEYVAVFRDVGAMLFFFALPFAYPLLYAFIYNTEVVYDVPLAVVDNSRTQLSREMCRRIDASPNTEILSYCANLDEAKELLKNRQPGQTVIADMRNGIGFLFQDLIAPLCPDVRWSFRQGTSLVPCPTHPEIPELKDMLPDIRLRSRTGKTFS